MTERRDPTAARLCAAYGCSACKYQQIGDGFLTEHSRYWCGKQKASFCSDDRAADDCPHWAFNGSDELLEALDQPKIPGVEV